MHRLRHPLSRAEKEKFDALDRRHDRRHAGGDGRHHRPQRRRQEHAAEDPQPHRRARRRGRVELYGQVGSLLEVGTGFHPELTGRENVYLNGAILGMKRKEIDREFDSIIEFAEIEPVPRHAGEALQQRHVRAARVRGRGHTSTPRS